MKIRNRPWLRLLPLGLAAVLSACNSAPEQTGGGQSPPAAAGDFREINLYSGREEQLVQPIIDQFEKDSGIKVNVKYGSTSEMAAAILEEGAASRADVFLAQDAGALGALSKKGMFSRLDAAVLNRVPEKFRSEKSDWVGITGRARTVVYNTEKVSQADLPESIMGFTDAKWKGKIGWAPSNGSFQAFVTAFRKLRGDEAAKAWLEGIKGNDAGSYPKNGPIVQAVSAGEIDVGFVNHYYLVEMKQEDPGIKAANHFFRNADVGGLVNVSGAGVLKTSKAQRSAKEMLEYFLSRKGQEHWAGGEFEYPLVQGVQPAPDLPPLAQLSQPKIDLSDLDDLEGTLTMLREVGLL